MATTPAYALPYPIGTDLIMNGDDAIRALAERVEAVMAQRDAVPSGRRNAIRNGDMMVAQRGAGPWTADGYTVDGYKKASVGGTVTVTRVAPTPGQTAARYALQVVTAGQSAAADFAMVEIPIEYVNTLAGQQVTLSFVASTAAGTPKIGVSIRQFFGTGGSPTTVVNQNVGIVSMSVTTPTRYSLTFTMPSVSGATYGTNGDDSLGIRLWLSSGTGQAAFAGAIGIQNGTITLSDVQLEAGAVATPFERLPMAQQLAWCQRYFQRFAAPAVGYYLLGGVTCITASLGRLPLRLPVPMRAVPTSAFTGTFAIDASGPANCTLSANTSVSTPETVVIDVAITGTMTVGSSGVIRSGGAATFDLSTEL